MIEPLEIDLPPETGRILQSIALAGVLGATVSEVAAYLIVRGLDDLMRAGVLKLESVEAKP